MKGRKPKPVDQKKLEGNPGKRKLNQGEPRGAPGGPTCPESIVDEERSIWFRVVGVLPSYRASASDEFAIEVFASAVAQYRRAKGLVKEQGDLIVGAGGAPIKNPAHTVLRDAVSTIDKFGAKLGLSPADRARLMNGESESEDELSEFLKSA